MEGENKMIKAGIIGATGYAGVELVRLLSTHPEVILVALSSVSYEGKELSEIYPNLKGICDQVLKNDKEVIEKSDVIFASLPHGLSEEYAKLCDEKNKKFIDLGADFRLYQEEDYQEWYGLNYNEKQLHEKSIYALPELYRDEIVKHNIIGNPGCYPTSIALGLYPLLKYKLVDVTRIIIDSKSGVSGSGRKMTQNTHYPDLNETFSAYKIAEHRHTPEIEQTLSDIAKEKAYVTFVPHLLPINRGILSTIYLDLKKDVTLEEIYQYYIKEYENEPFVRVRELGEVANIKNIRFSNFCDISLHFDKRTNRVIVVSTIDNMIKGAAGQAIQNMNLLFGLKETTGLQLVPPAF